MLVDFAANGTLQGSVDAALSRVSFTADLKEALSGAKYVQVGSSVLSTLCLQCLYKSSGVDCSTACPHAIIAQECCPETVEMKKKVFADLDALADNDTILASSSSCIAPSLFTAELKHRSHCLVTHPVRCHGYNPTHCHWRICR